MRRVVGWGAKAVLGCLLVWWYGHQFSWDEVFKSLQSAQLEFVLSAFLITVANIFLGVYRWKLLLEPWNCGASYFLIYRLSLAGIFLNTFTPGSLGGDIVRGVSTESLGVSLAQSASSVLTDRTIGLFGLVLMSLAGLLMYGWNISSQESFIFQYLLGVGLIIFVVLILYSHRISRLLGRIPFIKGRFRDRLSSLSRALRFYRDRPQTIGKAILVSLASSVLMIVSYYLLALALGATVSFRYFLIYVPAIAIISMVPLTIGGIGIREAGYVFFFSNAGMPAAIALALGLLISLLLVLIAAAAGAVVLVSSTVTNRH